MKLWESFNDLLPEGNQNKIPQNLQKAVLQSKCFGRAPDLYKKVSTEIIQSNDGALAIANTIHRVDPLSAVIATFTKFLAVLHAVRGKTRSLKIF